jgi:UPF0755 protein
MKFACALLALILSLMLLAGVWGKILFDGRGPLQNEVLVTIPQGASVIGIGQLLSENGVVYNPIFFRAGVEALRAGPKLQAGEYAFPAGISLRQTIDKMVRGDIVIRQFTIPEGLTVHQIVARLNDIPELSGDVTRLPQEGRLLPQTYRYNAGETRQSIIDRMEKAMTETLDRLWAERDPDIALSTPDQALTLASIVEKETGVGRERATIAGVFYNRMRIGMPLQSDPTAIYALTDGKPQEDGQGPLGRRLTTKDLSADSPYNTYQNTGLPPGPIANPGEAALEAVLHPESNDFLFFVADGTGGHVFATDLADHNRNAAAWRKARKAAGN